MVRRSAGCSRRIRRSGSSEPRNTASGSLDDGRGPHVGDPQSGSSTSRRGDQNEKYRRSRTSRRGQRHVLKQTGGHGMFGDVWLELKHQETRRRRRVRRAHRRRVRAEGLLPACEGIREAASRPCWRALPLSDFQSHALRRLVPPRQLRRAVVGDSRPRWRASANRAARADHARADLDPEALWVRSSRPQRPPRSGAWAWTPAQRGAGHHRPRPAGRAVLLTLTELRSLAQGRGCSSAQLTYEDVPSTSPRRSSPASQDRRGRRAVTDRPAGR